MTASAGAKINLDKTYNTRDLGGYAALDGRKIKHHRLIRSGELSKLTEKDIAVLTGEYGLRTIVDLRDEDERMRDRDIVPDGVKYIAHPIFKEDTPGITWNRDEKENDFVEYVIGYAGKRKASGKDFLREIYAKILADDYMASMYAKFFDILLSHEEGSVLWHCSAGKDRAGTAAALVLCALGVDRETVVYDYKLSNDFLHENNERVIAQVEQRVGNDSLTAVIRSIFSVKEEYIRAVFKYIDDNFKSMDEFFDVRLGMTEDKRRKLCDMYLE